MIEGLSSDVSTTLNIPIMDIVEYFEDAKRPMREGEEIVNAGWVYAIGIPPPPSRNHVIGLVIQTSSVSGCPHEVKLDALHSKPTSWKCECSCKAGQSGKCKHIAACLIHINREPQLYGISCTELKQRWGKTGRAIVGKYSAICASDMCHTREKIDKISDIVTKDQQAQFVSEFLEVAPNFELAKIFNSNRSVTENICSTAEDNEFFRFIIQHSELKKFNIKIKTYLKPEMMSDFSKVSLTTDEAIALSKSTIQQTSAEWLMARKIRITGSISYSLYTYSFNRNQNWEKKLRLIYSSNFKGNEATRYGQYAEKIAKQVYGKHCLLFESGLMVSPELPFLAVSPDGIAFNGDEWRLLEIKSPVKGKECSGANMLKTLKYLQKTENDDHELSQRHSYYGQIQLGLAITNLKVCDLIIFSTYDNTYEAIKVFRDEGFIKTYIEKLSAIYFEHVMPYVFKT